MDVSGKHVPVLKDGTAVMQTGFQEVFLFVFFFSGCQWGRMEWCSEGLKWQRILCLPLRLKPWRLSPRSGWLELMPCAGTSSQYKQQCLFLTPHSLPVSQRGCLTEGHPAAADPSPFFGSETLDLLYRSHCSKGGADVSIPTKQSLLGQLLSPI